MSDPVADLLGLDGVRASISHEIDTVAMVAPTDEYPAEMRISL